MEIDARQSITKYMEDNPEKLELLMHTTNTEEVRAVFLEGGYELDGEAAESFVKRVQTELTRTDELTEDDLEDVNGGSIVGAVICGAILGAMIGGAAVAIYKYSKYGFR